MSLPTQLSATHARAMANRPWRADEFAALLSGSGVFLIGGPTCFALGRIAMDEAELLTLATDPAHQRKGLASAALDRFHATAAAKGAKTAFLEVSADNHAALALYSGCGWAEAGRRRAYYDTATGRVDALVMRRDLTLGHATPPG